MGSNLQSLSTNFAAESTVRAICLVLNHLLDQQESSRLQLQKEAGKVLEVAIAPMCLVFQIDHQGYFQAAPSADNMLTLADSRIAMQWTDLANMLKGPASMTRTMARKANIEGDVDFIQTVSAVFNNLSWDAERDVANLLGDAQAVWAMNGLNLLGTNVKDLLERFKNNLREYLVHEKALIPTSSEFLLFRTEVDKLRDDLARLEKRLVRLSAHSKPGVVP